MNDGLYAALPFLAAGQTSPAAVQTAAPAVKKAGGRNAHGRATSAGPDFDAALKAKEKELSAAENERPSVRRGDKTRAARMERPLEETAREEERGEEESQSDGVSSSSQAQVLAEAQSAQSAQSAQAAQAAQNAPGVVAQSPDAGAAAETPAGEIRAAGVTALSMGSGAALEPVGQAAQAVSTASSGASDLAGEPQKAAEAGNELAAAGTARAGLGETQAAAQPQSAETQAADAQPTGEEALLKSFSDNLQAQVQSETDQGLKAAPQPQPGQGGQSAIPQASGASVPTQAAAQNPASGQKDAAGESASGMAKAEAPAAVESATGTETVKPAAQTGVNVLGETRATVETAAPRGAALSESRQLELIQQVAKNVEASLQSGRNTLRMQLNPAELGAIDIRLASSGHTVSVTVIAEQAGTGRLLEAQLSQLRQTLADAGVQLSQLNVSQQNAGQNGQGGLTQSYSQPQTRAANVRDLGQVEGVEISPEGRGDRSRSGGVDYRA